MKKMNLILNTLVILFLSRAAFSQNINWANVENQKHIVNINTGWDFAIVYGGGYAYQLKTKKPIVLNVSCLIPAGKNVLDDFKTKMGGQIRLFQMNHVHFTAKINGVIRRYENPLVRLVNLGSDVSAMIGYYQPKWYIAGEVSFDNALRTNFKHSTISKDTYQMVQDGWYKPASGGNFYYGLQTGVSFKKSDITFSIGKAITQDFKTTPLIPYYAQLGLNLKIN